MTKEWKELRQRQRAMAACGNPDWVKCKFCKAWGPSDTMVSNVSGCGTIQWLHRQCHADYVAARRKIPEVGERWRARDKKRGSNRPNRSASLKKYRDKPTTKISSNFHAKRRYAL